MNKDIATPLNEAMESYKQYALSEFVKNFLMPALKQHSCDIENLLEALADYTLARSGWEQATKLLEDAASEIRRSRCI